MKGFLSFMGITLIVGAMAMILFSFTGNPLEDLTTKERLFTYTEIRENYSSADLSSTTYAASMNSGSALHESSPFYLASDDNCRNPAQ